jgi:uncharacterized Zn-binding protein involved in type VI secretion
MGVTVGVNKRSVVHKASGGVSTAPLDVCKLVNGIPAPLLNVARSEDLQEGTRSVKCDGKPVAIDGSVIEPTKGDEPGKQGGVASGKTQGKAKFVSFSDNVMFEGKGVARAFDLMTHNDDNTMVAPIIQANVAAVPPDAGKEDDDDGVCAACGKKH